MKPLLPTLLLITNSTVCSDLLDSVTAALEGGVRHILLREKGMAAAPLTVLAKKLLRLTASAGAHVLIHDRLDIALAVQAAGVHLPASGIPTRDARQLLDAHPSPAGTLLGRSCHSVDEACLALQEGADFVTLSPLFATRSHPQAPALGLQRFAAMRRKIPGPVLALGGIEANNVVDAMATGADGIALIRAILGAPDPQQAAEDIISQMTSSYTVTDR